MPPPASANRDLYRLRYPTTAHRTRAERRQLSARISRQLRLLRAHGVIKKVQKRHRYRVTANGHLLTAALFAVRETTLEQLVGTVAA